MKAPARVAALLRAVNVGGTGKLAMRDLERLCMAAGFHDVKTYIQSGNVVFGTAMPMTQAGAMLERALSAHMGAPVDVLMRDADALARIVRDNPFPDADGARVVVLFCANPVNQAAFQGVVGPDGEIVVAAAHEVFVHYVNGQGRSKLKLPKMVGAVTARNMNTVSKLLAMTRPGWDSV